MNFGYLLTFKSFSGWSSYRLQIQEALAVQREQQAQTRRYNTVAEYYPLVVEALDNPSLGVLPALHEFTDFPTVQVLWKPSGADASQAAFDEQLEAIVAEMEVYQEKSRVKAIRSILAANRDVPLSKLSSKSTAYPPADYDSDFFNLATSVFCRWWTKEVVTFTKIAGTEKGVSFIKTGLRQTDAIIAMVEAAGSDTDTATWADLVKLGNRFRWKNRPGVSAVNTPKGCKELAGLIFYTDCARS